LKTKVGPHNVIYVIYVFLKGLVIAIIWNEEQTVSLSVVLMMMMRIISPCVKHKAPLVGWFRKAVAHTMWSPVLVLAVWLGSSFCLKVCRWCPEQQS